MEETRNRKRTASIIAVVVIALALIGGTFMWWTSSDMVKNEMALDRFDVKITEKFDPNTPVFPGADVTKEVGVTNNSNIPAVVRIQLEESIELAKAGIDGDIVQWSNSKALTGNQILVKVSQAEIDTKLGPDSGWKSVNYSDTDVKVLSREVPKPDGTGTTTEYFAYLASNNRLVKYEPTTPTPTVTFAYYERELVAGGPFYHEMTGRDLPADLYHKYIEVIRNTPLKAFGDAGAGWVLDASTGWYYYNTALHGSNATTAVNLIDKVSFKNDLPENWQGAKYVLTPHMQAAQYDKAAITDTWGAVPNGMVFFDGTETITFP